jgi:site-specific recombinase XerD
MNSDINILLKSYRMELKIVKYSKSTVNNYYTIIKNFVAWSKEANFTINNVKKYLFFIVEKGLSSNTVSLHINALKSFFRIILKSDILSELRHPKRNKSLPYILSRKEIIKLINSIKNRKHKLMIAFLYGSGLRVGEVVNIKVKDIDLDKKRIIIRNGKGKKDRIVIISRQLIEPLREIISEKQKNDYIFKPQNGKNYSKRTVQHIFSVALKNSGINKHSTCHTLRHSFATHLLENGTNIVSIQKLLGHKNVNTTMIYTKLAKNSLDDIDSPL